MTHAAQPHTLKTVELVGTATNIIEQLKKKYTKLENGFALWEEQTR